MSERRIDAFFYGLFMDEALLRSSGVAPANPRAGYVDGFKLRIGQRATLVPSEGVRSYGVIFQLTHAELSSLYSAPGLDRYRAEAVFARTLDGHECAALCYNLLEEPATHEQNPEYAGRLQAILRKLGFPAEYVAAVL